MPRLQKGLITIGVICDKGTEVKFKFQECLAVNQVDVIQVDVERKRGGGLYKPGHAETLQASSLRKF